MKQTSLALYFTFSGMVTLVCVWLCLLAAGTLLLPLIDPIPAVGRVSPSPCASVGLLMLSSTILLYLALFTRFDKRRPTWWQLDLFYVACALALGLFYGGIVQTIPIF